MQSNHLFVNKEFCSCVKSSKNAQSNRRLRNVRMKDTGSQLKTHDQRKFMEMCIRIGVAQLRVHIALKIQRLFKKESLRKQF